MAQSHPDEKELLARDVDTTGQKPHALPIEYRIVPAGRGVRYLPSGITTVESDAWRPMRIIGTLQDANAQRSADRVIAAHVAVSEVLGAWDSFEKDGMLLLRGLAEAMEFVAGTLWLPDHDCLTPRLIWSDPSVDASEFEAATLALRVPRGVGVVGRAWERGVPVSVADVLLAQDYLRRKTAARAGVRGAVAFPALSAGQVLAVLEFCSAQECRPSARLTQTLIAIGTVLGEFLSRRQGQLRSSPLTQRELQVLQLTANGCSRGRTAEVLTVSSATVASHMKHIFERLGVADRASAVATGIRLGLIE